MNADTIRALRELAKTAKEGYCGLAAYGCSDIETEMAQFLAGVASQTANQLEAEAKAAESQCPYTFAHTRHWCGNDTCRDG